MARQDNLFKRLKKLFSTGVVVRHVGGKKLKVADTDSIQGYLSNVHRDRYSRIFSTPGMHNTWNNQYGMNMAYQTQRIMLFREYDIADSDPIICAALNTYADESCLRDEKDEVLTIECDNEDVKEILYNLFYDIVNVEFNLYPWIRNLCKYGDMFLFLEIAEEFGIINVQPLSVYDTIRVEGEDPENPRYTYFQTMGMDGRKVKYEAYEIAHFRLMSDSNWLPYGRSMLEGARRTWKVLTLLEDALLIHRIMRAPDKRIIKVDVGNIPPAEIDTYMHRLGDKMKKVPFMDPQTGEYNLRYNLMNILEDIYIPVRGGNDGTDVTNIPGLEFNGIEDVEYIKNRMMAALSIPKAFLGYDESLNGKATLSGLDVRFARTIERIQRIVVQELKNIAIVHLYAQGYRDENLINFKLKLTTPSTIAEQEKVNLWKEKTMLANDIQMLKLIGSDWIYKNIFNMSEQEIEEQRQQVAADVKRTFRYQQIESGQSDPAKYGFPQDQLPAMQDDQAADGMPPDQGMGEEEVLAGESKMGRPRTGARYGQDSHVRGRDPLGFDERYKAIHGPHHKRRASSKSLSMEAMDALSTYDKSRSTVKNSILREEKEESEEMFTDFLKDIEENDVND